ncbi:hypothetical protein GALL_380680 [mine drainage metagenome]|uniref:Uncharacterized protein n=1 Tax=mine drainage metagenome TaxID=410659 RepID=A0A1J5Q947_9ZZZZ
MTTAARAQVHRPRAYGYGALLVLAAWVGGPFAWIVLEFVAGMTFVSLVTDLAHKAMPFRFDKARALRVAIAISTASAACSIAFFILAFHRGTAVYTRNGIWCALFCGEGALHYIEHVRRAAILAESGRPRARR